MGSAHSEAVLRGLIKIWTDFDTSLNNVPLIAKLNRDRLRLDDYKQFLINHRQQVIEGARWIARAASGIDEPYVELRSLFMKHAVTEHRDFEMLERDYVSVGGVLEDIRRTEKNIGTEALHAFMYHRASQPNPFDLLGAMFIIEGLGQKKALEWGKAIQRQLALNEHQVSFLLYHGANDDEHMEQFDSTLNSGILEIPEMDRRITRTAQITARLYRLQLEEIGVA